MKLGTLVSSRRRSLGMSQKELAYRAGQTQDALYNLEQGRAKAVPFSRIVRLARALEIELEYFATADECRGERSEPASKIKLDRVSDSELK
jgi:transcriptional regulator with XRE-family HTH domain